MADEIERRWLVEKVDLDLSTLPSKEIAQAYPNTPPEESFRVRIIDGERAVLTYKTGLGVSRAEFERELPDLETARGLYERFPLKIAKRRYLHEGYEIDVYEGPLKGLLIVEREQQSLEDVLPIPSWMRGAIEVTDSVNNVVLARLSKLLEGSGYTQPLHSLLVPRSARALVLTGGPGSGKSTAIEALRADPDIGPQAHFVPEVATFVIAQVGILPPDREQDAIGYAKFQQTLAQVQILIEDGAIEQATRDGKRLVVLDRAFFDNAAYLKGGIEELHTLTRLDMAAMMKRYSRVIQLDTPPQEVYERIRNNNAARRESYAQAYHLTVRIREAWRPSPNHVFVENMGGWEPKYALVREIVLNTLKAT